MVDINRSLKKMMGKSLNIPKFGIPTKRDWDGDGIPNFRDCQPRNMVRQDSVKNKYGIEEGMYYYNNRDNKTYVVAGRSKNGIFLEEVTVGKKTPLIYKTWEQINKLLEKEEMMLEGRS